MNAVVEPVTGYFDLIVTTRSYGVMRPGLGKVNVCLRNHSENQVTLLNQTAVGEIAVANSIPSLLAPKPTEDDSGRGKAIAQYRQSEGQKELLEKN